MQPETSEKRTGDERPERVMKDPRGLLKEKFFEVIKQLKFILTSLIKTVIIFNIPLSRAKI